MLGAAALATLVVSCAPPSSPSNVQAVAGDRRVLLSWDESPGATSYNVYWSTVPGLGQGGWEVSVTKPSFAHQPIANGRAYYYVVTALAHGAESKPSVEVQATPVDIPVTSLVFADAALAACLAEHRYDSAHEVLTLFCDGRGITDLAGIEELYNLEWLVLRDNAISDLSALSDMQALLYLNMDFNAVTDLTPLATLQGLVSLRVEGNAIADLSPLTDFTNLAIVNLNGNQVVDVSPLSGITARTTLLLEDNLLGGAGVGHLESLLSLDLGQISLAGNPGISCSELGTLITAFGSPPVDVDRDLATSDIAVEGANCTTP